MVMLRIALIWLGLFATSLYAAGFQQMYSLRTAMDIPLEGGYAGARSAFGNGQRLHHLLNIQPAQEAAWNRFIESMQRPLPHPVNVGTKAPERLEKAIQLQHEYMTRRLSSLNALYKELTPEQRSIIDQWLKQDDSRTRRVASCEE